MGIETAFHLGGLRPALWGWLPQPSGTCLALLKSETWRRASSPGTAEELTAQDLRRKK